MTTDHGQRLRNIAARLAASRAETDRLTIERDRCILEAIRAGGTYNSVADQAGVTDGFVSKVLRHERAGKLAPRPAMPLRDDRAVGLLIALAEAAAAPAADPALGADELDRRAAVLGTLLEALFDSHDPAHAAVVAASGVSELERARAIQAQLEEWTDDTEECLRLTRSAFVEAEGRA